MTRILHVVTNVSHYAQADHPTGLWLSELTHAWEVFEAAGFEQTLVSPAGGAVPLEPRSLTFPNADKTAKAWQADPTRMALLADTLGPDDIDAAEFDAILHRRPRGDVRLHGQRWAAPDHARDLGARRRGRIGVPRLLRPPQHHAVRRLLPHGKHLTGFSWTEERLARVDALVPYNAEQVATDRGAIYAKAKLPFVSFTQVDGRLVTGQNPGSAKETAQKVVAAVG